MLTAIREGSKGWISGIIIGLIVITFALFGISAYLEGGQEVPIATVNGEEISSYAYQNQLSQQRQALASRFGSDFDPALFDNFSIREQVLESLIESRVLNQYVADRNFRLSDTQLVERIQSNPAFQSDGKFDPLLYERLLVSNQITPQSYEQSERQIGATEQFRQAIVDSAFKLDSEVDRLLTLQTQSRDVDYALLEADRYVDEFDISDQEARKQYDDNLSLYQSDARVKVEYIDLNLEKIAQEVSPTQADIEQAYDRLKGQLTAPEVRKASHILFNVSADADEKTREEKRQKAEQVLQLANSGEDFAELAKTHSDDSGSAVNGGDLGIVTRGQMVQPFEDAVFSMSEGDIEGLVETQFGFHIIKLTELEEERQQSLEEVREEVEQDASRALAEEQFSDLVEPFENLIFEQPDSLLPASDEIGFPVETSDWFTLAAGEGIAMESAVRRAAFAEDVLDDGLNSQAIELGFERVVAIRKLDHEPAAIRSFEEVKEEIVTSLKRQKSAERVAEEGAKLIEGLTHKASWDIRLAKNELLASKLGATREEVAPEFASLADQVYAADAPEGSNPSYGYLVLSNGDAVLYALNAVSDGVVTDVDPALRQRMEQQLADRDGSDLYRQAVILLRSDAEVVIDNEQL